MLYTSLSVSLFPLETAGSCHCGFELGVEHHKPKYIWETSEVF